MPTLEHSWEWKLSSGVLIFAGTTLVLAALAEHVMTGRPLTVLDQQLSAWIGRNRSPQLTTFFIIMTSLGSTVAATAIAIGVGIYLLRRRQRYWFAAMTLTIVGGATLNRFLKLAFQRARPQLDDPIRTFAGYSFPSGHTVTATVVYGTVALLLFTKVKSLRSRVVVITSATLVIMLVGFSRIYLGAHYLTDVLAAIAEGVAWISLSFTVVDVLKRARLRRASGVKPSL
jgi:membrane-associated phospholipid phosphatase